MNVARLNTVGNRLFLFIMSHRLAIVLLVLAATALFGALAARVQFDNSIETYFLENDLRDYRQFLHQFGSDEIIAVAFGEEDIFTPENLALIENISNKLEQMKHVRRVISLTRAKIVYGQGHQVSFNTLYDQIPENPEALQAVKVKALADPFLPGTVISPDGQHTAIIAEVDHIIGEFDYKVELLSQIRHYLHEEEQRTGKHFRIGGTSVIDDAVFHYTQEDQTRLFPVMILVIIAIMLFMFRQFSLALLPLVVVLFSIVWTYGFLVLLGYKINVISVILSPLLLAVAIADSMHFTADYLNEAANHTDSKVQCIGRTFRKLIAPCSMTSITTILGLLSLLAADLAPIRQFGLVAAAGVAFAYIITLLLLPILLSLLPFPKEKHRESIRSGLFSRLLVMLGHWQRGKALLVLTLGVLVVVPAFYLLTQLQVGTNSLDYFKKNDQVRRQTEWIDARVGGTSSLEFLVDGGAEDAMKDPLLLEKMERFQEYLKSIDGVTGVLSPVDMVKSLNRAFHGGDERDLRLPSSQIAVAQQLFIVEGSREVEELLSDDYSQGRISARVELNRSRQLAHRMPEIERNMHRIFGSAARTLPTGVVFLMNRMEHYLLSSQIKSFLLAFIVITVCMILMLRSIPLGLIAMIPNLMPVLVTLAIMPLLHIPLDVGTVMIACVALGLVVDDTIHFLSNLKLETTHTPDTRVALAATVLATGRPIIFTSLVLSLGFLVMTLASFNPIIHFGILSGMVILLAMVFDLVVLPALLGFVKLSW